ncbi:DUF6465 family protein [Hespellia stercorisuis]|uniref:Uncharacterized protein n=1 Tax=Hespellia stercorisuis DSM 15480 TaxID=1121950 RepID=A0A1M6KPK2_9FIRM|nr:DUF6465 family protein [Hespellia stercorisuis]SHJ60821.1 hypothetical protein SAMN02745243_00980 [Hespellia stercorisuis DSM 15480]
MPAVPGVQGSVNNSLQWEENMTRSKRAIKKQRTMERSQSSVPAAVTTVDTVQPAVTKETVTFEFAGKKVKMDEVMQLAKDAFTQSHEGTAIESIDLYIVAEENAAYYVVNGEGSEDFKITL